MAARTLFKAVLIFCLSLALSHVAIACVVRGAELNDKDFARAGVVFDAKVKAIFPTFRETPIGKSVTDYKILFEVINTRRGRFPSGALFKQGDERLVKVSWRHSTYGYPHTLEAFVEEYGEEQLVGLTTPETFKKPCELTGWKKWLSRRQQIVSPNCDRQYTGYYNHKRALSELFIMNKGCSGPYMFRQYGTREAPKKE